MTIPQLLELTQLDAVLDALVATQDRLLALYELTRTLGQVTEHGSATQELLAQMVRLTRSCGAVLSDPEGDPVLTVGPESRFRSLAGYLAHESAHGPAEPHIVVCGPVVLLVMRLAAGDQSWMLGLARDNGISYETADLKLVDSIAALLGGVLNLIQLHESGLRRARIQQEHQLASTLAQAALQAHLPDVPGLGLFARCLPANLSGGDFYAFAYRAGTLWFAVGDVAGKGLPAATVMTRAISVVRGAFVLGDEHGAQRVLTSINEELYGYLVKVGLFITMVLGCYHPENRLLELLNAGHNPVFLIQQGKVQTVDPCTPPIGVLPDVYGTPSRAVLQDGDLVALGSDGLTEQEDPQGIQFGQERLATLLAAAAGTDIQGLGEQVLAAVQQYANGRSAIDDRTLVLLRPEK